jgi:cytochrome c biogenesis protein
MIGFFYPTTMTLTSGALSSSYPDLLDATLTLEAYTGDLGLNEGVPTSAYELDTASLTQVAGRKSTTKTLTLSIGETAELPDGLGSVELTSVKRFVSLDVHHDPTSGWVLAFALLVLGGLLTGLFVPRRRVWIKAIDTDGGVRLEYAALARGEDPGLDAAITAIAQKHGAALGLKVEQ